MSDVFIAVWDDADDSNGKSGVVGAFESEQLARAACQDEEAEAAEVKGMPSVLLVWNGDEASAGASVGGVFVVIMTRLNHRVGY